VRRALSVWLVTLALAATVSAQKRREYPKPQGWVNDFAAAVRPMAKKRLTELCSEVNLKTHAQIAVVTIATTEGIPIGDYATGMFNQWGVGHKEDNRGILILLAISDHNWRIATGLGFQTLLSDDRVAGIGAEMVPDLRKGQYSEALLLATNEIARIISTERGIRLSTLDHSSKSNAPAPWLM
jgi:uncharacterized protein